MALSLTVKRISIVLLTDGNTSQVGVKLPAITSLICGIYLIGMPTGNLDLNIGPCVLVGEGALEENGFSGSFSSQQKDKLSPASTSVPTPSNLKAVDFGIV